MRLMQAISTPRSEMLVRDIMQRIGEWKVVDIEDVERATVASVAQLFTDSDLSHVPVMETDARGEQRLRGLLCAARVKRLLTR